MEIKYEPLADSELWWCNSHQRRATHMLIHKQGALITRCEPHCDPKLGGILLPCSCVNLTNLCVIVDYGNPTK